MITATKPAGIATGCPDVGAYIACLASYNNGTLHGAWVDLELVEDVDDIQECIAWVMATSSEPGAEEYAVHDWSGVPRSMQTTEWPNWAETLPLLKAVAEYGEAFEVWHDNAPGYNLDPADFRDAYVGSYDSGADFVREWYEEHYSEGLTAVDSLVFAIDWEAVWKRGEISQSCWGSEGASGYSAGFHVFNNN